MINKEQIEEIREHLENARNPVFFFDNDADGLCSFLILQRKIARGRGVVIKSYPGLDESYFKRVEEFKADYIFVLDKPQISEGFIKLAKEAGIPLVYIDHHSMPKPDIEFYYNGFYTDGKNEPVSYICYKVSGKKEDLWLAVIGCIEDSFIPEFLNEFRKEYPDLIDTNFKTASDIRYKTRLGEISSVLNFALKDKTSNVVALMKFLMKARSPHDIVEEKTETKTILKRFKEINEKYRRLLKNAEDFVEKDRVVFSYSGDMSLSQYIADELMYYHPGKVIVVIYSKGNLANVSLRWNKDIRTPTVNVVNSIDGATGGGHENSTGARVPADKIPEFKEKLFEEIEKIKKS